MARFTLPRDLYHGKGALEELKNLKGNKAIVVVGGGSMKRFGFLDREMCIRDSYTIDGVKIAREIGLGGRINTILQAAFFKLTEIIPAEEAIGYMKAAAEASYGRKGEQVVAMNPVSYTHLSATWRKRSSTTSAPRARRSAW